jgi:hypothetical protein
VKRFLGELRPGPDGSGKRGRIHFFADTGPMPGRWPTPSPRRKMAPPPF